MQLHFTPTSSHRLSQHHLLSRGSQKGTASRRRRLLRKLLRRVWLADASHTLPDRRARTLPARPPGPCKLVCACASNPARSPSLQRTSPSTGSTLLSFPSYLRARLGCRHHCNRQTSACSQLLQPPLKYARTSQSFLPLITKP